MNPSEHLTAGELAAHLDRLLTGDDRARVECHLEACAECRAEWLAVARLAESFEVPGRADPALPSAKRSTRWWMPLAIGAGLAAGFAMILLLQPGRISRPGSGEPVRAPDFGEGRAQLDLVGPSPDSLAPRIGLTLAWRGSASTLYRVSLLTESGEPLWMADTPDTAIAVPDTVSLVPGRSYFWRAEGIANGIISSTGAHRLRVRP